MGPQISFYWLLQGCEYHGNICFMIIDSVIVLLAPFFWSLIFPPLYPLTDFIGS